MHPQTKDKCHIIGHTLTLLLLMLKRHQREKNFVILYIHIAARLITSNLDFLMLRLRLDQPQSAIL